MQTLTLVLESVWKILVVALVLGAGLPALFAVGVRGLAISNGHGSEGGTAKPNPLGNVLAGVCFLIVIAAIAVGLMVMVAPGFGMKVSFDHIYPVLVSKS